MPNPVVYDREGRKYELHPAVFIERGRKGLKGVRAITREEFVRAFATDIDHISTLSNHNAPIQFLFFRKMFRNGWIRIGCRIFNKTNADKIRRWAERTGK